MNYPDYLRVMSQVILQTYIESLRARTGQIISVNHHGGVKTITGEKVIICEMFNIDCAVCRKADHPNSSNQQIRSCKTIIKSLQLF